MAADIKTSGVLALFEAEKRSRALSSLL